MTVPCGDGKRCAPEQIGQRVEVPDVELVVQRSAEAHADQVGRKQNKHHVYNATKTTRHRGVISDVVCDRRSSDKTALRPEKSVLLLQVWYCFVKNDLVTLVVIMILKDTATFQLLFIVSLFCARNISTVEINSGVHLLKS